MNKDIKSLSSLFFEIGNLIKEYEDYNKVKKAIEVKEELYGINEICEIYPVMTKHKITKAINAGELPVTWVGNERCFYLKDIDNYLASCTSKKNINTWRTTHE